MILEIKAPSPGESVAEVIIDRWLKQDGEYVEQDEVIAELQSDKANLEVVAEEAGVLKILAKEGETVTVGQVIAQIDTDAKPAESPAKKEEPTPETVSETSTDSEKVAMPSAEKMMKEKGISPEEIQGTGKGGRITKEDVVKHIQSSKPSTQQAETLKKTSVPQPKPQPAKTKGERNVRVEPLSHLRKVISKRLVYAKNETAMLTTFNEVDLSQVIATRKKYKEDFIKKYGIKLGFMSFFVKACSLALLEFPQVNSQLTEDGQSLKYFDYVDMAIAVSTDRGLLVPVIRNAESLSLAEIEMAIADLAKRAREGKIGIEDMQGGTFTITNGGVFGSLVSTPILNPPQTAILGMHRIQERPVAVNGQVEIRPMMYLALSYDHRVIDGKEAVSFLYRVVKLLEDPVRMLLEI